MPCMARAILINSDDLSPSLFHEKPPCSEAPSQFESGSCMRPTSMSKCSKPKPRISCTAAGPSASILASSSSRPSPASGCSSVSYARIQSAPASLCSARSIIRGTWPNLSMLSERKGASSPRTIALALALPQTLSIDPHADDTTRSATSSSACDQASPQSSPSASPAASKHAHRASRSSVQCASSCRASAVSCTPTPAPLRRTFLGLGVMPPRPIIGTISQSRVMPSDP
mmetsp:Transcript_25185/g.63580  ORF Transcript_25185/g.63580 Transcript_25185/m.63580 type:complete len:229 (-) Transcript_25185:549-1235(-)